MIEEIAQVLANSNINEKVQECIGIRNFLYGSDERFIDFEKTLNLIKNIKISKKSNPSSDLLDEIWLKLTADEKITSYDNPVAYVLGGQPGAGNSKLIKKVIKRCKHNVFIINADEYRKYHPNYAKFQTQDDKTSQDKTAKFIAEVTENLLQKAIQNRFNLVIEGTFRTSSTPKNTKITKIKQL